MGRVYVCGPMTGLPEHNFPAFNAAAERLIAQGRDVWNPADTGLVDGWEWGDYLRHDLVALTACDSIYVLRGYGTSRGAQLEIHVAKALGMTVEYEGRGA